MTYKEQLIADIVKQHHRGAPRILGKVALEKLKVSREEAYSLLRIDSCWMDRNTIVENS